MHLRVGRSLDMTGYIVRRLIIALIVLILVSMLVFTILRFLPGDPIFLYIQENIFESLTPEVMHELRVQYGLDKSLPEQYFVWITGILHGDFGKSILYRMSVLKMISQALPVTISLSIPALFISAILGISFGTISALRRGKWMDTVATMLANLGITAPSFWVGILLMYLLALKLGWLPPYGYVSPFTDFGMYIKKAIMPVICLSIFPIGALTRQTRSSMLEVVRQDYIRTAWSKGLQERVIVTRHALKNALIPVVTLLGMQVRSVIGGMVVIETVFNVPGVGRMSVEALFSRDFIVVQAIVLMTATIVILSNLAVDIAYGFFDPRIRYN
jgi:peptide/nickel transport system permease protein